MQMCLPSHTIWWTAPNTNAICLPTPPNEVCMPRRLAVPNNWCQLESKHYVLSSSQTQQANVGSGARPVYMLGAANVHAIGMWQ